MSDNHVAIDPGASGGVAYVDANGTVCSAAMPASPAECVELLKELRKTHGRLVIEQIPKFTGAKIPGSTVAVLFESYGIIIGAAIALGFQLERLTPQAWQGILGLGNSKGMSKTEWKNKLKGRAMELFPGQKVTLKTADALLIWKASLGR